MNALAVRSWPRIRFTSGTLEALKWFAVACMVLDHANRALTGYTLGPAAEFFGRLAFPIFAVVFGYNLARPGVDAGAIALRLSAWGTIAAFVYVPLFGLWPLNVLFTLSLAAAVIRLRAWWLVVPLGLLVDYLWPGMVLVIATWAYTRRPGPAPVWLAGGALLGISALVGNLYAFAAVPLLAIATRLDFAVTRSRWVFLAVYVGHLTVLLLIHQVK